MERVPINLAELERLAKAATPGPWYWKPSEWDCDFEHDDGEHVKDCHSVAGAYITPFLLDCGEYHGLADNDASHIAAVSPDVVLRLVAALNAMGEQLAHCLGRSAVLAILAEHGITDTDKGPKP